MTGTTPGDLKTQPGAIARALLVSSVLGVSGIAAGVILDRVLAAAGLPGSYDATVVIVTVLAFLGAALIVASIAFSAVQSAVDRWPSYLYGSVMQQREPLWFLYGIAAGMVTGLGTLGIAAAGVGFGYGGSLISLLLALVVVVVLIHYIASQTLQLDPLLFSDRLRDDLNRTRRRLWLDEDSVRAERRTSAAQLHYLERIDQLLGMSRWLAERERPHDAVEVLWMVVDELAGYRRDRQARLVSRPSTVTGFWNYRSTYAPLYADLPGSSSSYLAMIQASVPKRTPMSLHPSETDWGVFWLEEHALTWTICSAAYVQERSPRVEVVRWEKFLHWACDWIDDAIDWDRHERSDGLTDRLTGLAAGETLIINLTRPLLLPGLENRRSRDAAIREMVGLYERILTQLGDKPEVVGQWHAAVFPYIRGNSLLAERRFPSVVALGDALGFFGQLSRLIGQADCRVLADGVIGAELLMLAEDHAACAVEKAGHGPIADDTVEALDMRHAGTLSGRGKKHGVWQMVGDIESASNAWATCQLACQPSFLEAAMDVEVVFTLLPTWHLREDLRHQLEYRVLKLADEAAQVGITGASMRARQAVASMNERYASRPSGVGYADLPR